MSEYMKSGTVQADIGMRLLGHPADSGTAVTTTFVYDLTKPFAVETAFHLSDSDVIWTYARDLLIAGLAEHTGQGDVRIWPVLPPASSGVPPMVRMELTSPSGHALLEADAGEVSAFLQKTLQMCPHGQESAHLDIDAFLESVLRT